jgi:hypothetical protein
VALLNVPISDGLEWYAHYVQTDKLAKEPAYNPLWELRTDKLLWNKGEYTAVGAGAEQDLLNVTGPGNVEYLWMATPGPPASLDARLRIYYDGSGTPALDMDFGTLFAMHYGGFGPWHITPHVKVDVQNPSYNTHWLITFPMPFGTSIRVVYYNPGGAISSSPGIFWQAGYSIYDTDRGNGLRLRGTGLRLPSAVTLTAGQTYTLASITGAGAIIWHSYIGGFGGTPTNLSWLERNVTVAVDGEVSPSIVSSGTEDWFDGGWYYNDIPDYLTSAHSYVATCTPVGNAFAVGQATDLLSKWGGIPFTSSCVMTLATEAVCTTGHPMAYCILYYGA